jgi:hypothetical protein
MTWTVETLGPIVDDKIAALPADMQAAFLRLAERIEAVGLERIGAPHLRHLRDKLWEMRLSGRDGIARATSPRAASESWCCTRLSRNPKKHPSRSYSWLNKEQWKYNCD